MSAGIGEQCFIRFGKRAGHLDGNYRPLPLRPFRLGQSRIPRQLDKHIDRPLLLPVLPSKHDVAGKDYWLELGAAHPVYSGHTAPEW